MPRPRGYYKRPMSAYMRKSYRNIPRQRTPETAGRVCPACFAANGDPCREVLNRESVSLLKGKLKLGGVLNRIHPERS